MTMRRAIVYVALASALFLGFLPRSRAQGTSSGTRLSQPDRVLLDRALDAMKNKQYSQARSLLENLIECYRDSANVPRAKLLLGDAWYAEGAFQRAEMEYQDFVTFFPNRPEVATTKRKIESIQKRLDK